MGMKASLQREEAVEFYLDDECIARVTVMRIDPIRKDAEFKVEILVDDFVFVGMGPEPLPESGCVTLRIDDYFGLEEDTEQDAYEIYVDLTRVERRRVGVHVQEDSNHVKFVRTSPEEA